jgi:tyrosine-specific transport protein
MQNTFSLNSRFSLARLFSGSLMVFGTTVGAGMLGIPLMTAQGGFGSAFLATLLVWVFMALTGLLLLEVSLRMPRGANFITLSSEIFGKKSKWITIFIYLFLYYALMVAYFSGGAPLLGMCLSSFGLSLSSGLEIALFTLCFGGIVALGARFIDKTNAVLSLGMLVLFPTLILLGKNEVCVDRLFANPLSFSVVAVPVLFGAFGYHNIIPSLTQYLSFDRKILRVSILLGTFLAFILYVVWQWFVLGSLSMEALADILSQGLPVTYALAKGGNSHIFVLGQTFAFFALTTSFLGVSFSLVDFIQEALGKRKFLNRRIYAICLALLPPLICVRLDPHLFDRALGVAGGIGESLLNGIYPVLLFFLVHRREQVPMKTRRKMFLLVLLLFSLFVMGVEIRNLL